MRDVNLVTGEDIPEVDIITGGFPCQPFSIAGHQQGFDDEKNRGKLFFLLPSGFQSKAIPGCTNKPAIPSASPL